MLEQIKQVANTYLTQRMFWFLAAITGVMTLPTLVSIFAPQQKATDPIIVLMPIVMPLFFTPFFVGHVKMQLAHSRARLTPNFLPSHVIVPAAILFALLVVRPLAAATGSGLEPLGILALILGVGSSFLWGSHLNTFAPWLIGTAAYFSAMTPWGRNWWVTGAAEHTGIHAAIALAGLAAVMGWLWRICHLFEEDDDYQNVAAPALARRSGAETVEERRIAAWQIGRNRLTSRIGDWWHSRLSGYYGGSAAGRSRLLRYGFNPLPIEALAVFMALMLVGYGVFLRQLISSTSRGVSVMGNPLLLIAVAIVPGYISGEIMARRRTRVASEMLLPVSRTQLIDSLFAVSAASSTKLWLLLNATFGVLVLVFQQEQDVVIQTIVVFALLSATISFATFGMSMRAAVWPSMFQRVLSLWFSMFILASPILLWAAEHKTWGAAPFLGMAIALIVIGSLLLNAARHKWLNLEFA